MANYFPEQLGRDLDRNQQKVMTDRQLYGPVLDFLYIREEEFQTEDLVDSVSSGTSASKLDSHRASSLLGALRDEYI